MRALGDAGRRRGGAPTRPRRASSGSSPTFVRRVAGRPRPKTLLVFGREQGTLRRVNASAGYGFLHDVLELAGGADVLGDLRRQSADMSTEMILTRAPEVILELHYGESLKRANIAGRERQVWKALPSVPAVRNKRVYLLAGDEFVVPGPRIVRRRRALRHARCTPRRSSPWKNRGQRSSRTSRRHLGWVRLSRLRIWDDSSERALQEGSDHTLG